MDNLLNRFANAFPLWVFLCSALALWHPPLFTWFSGPWITWGLGVIMLGMGITLTAEDFTRVLQFPSWVAAGVRPRPRPPNPSVYSSGGRSPARARRGLRKRRHTA